MKHRRLKFCSVLALVMALLMVNGMVTVTASTGITTFTGLDPGAASGDARPNADAAAASFDAAAAALGNYFVEDLEGAPLGPFTNLVLLGGTVTTSGWETSAVLGSDEGPIYGYNTTPGGQQHINLRPFFASGTASVTFTYVAPLQAWGAYFTGVGTVPNTSIHVRFDDGSAQTFQVPGAPEGGASFFGFTDPGKLIESVRVEEDLTGSAHRDFFSIDDVRIAFSNSGFVTGGGWIDSPAGAYRPDDTLAGKANFGFVSKYKKGKTTPDGQTEFQFQTADLNFHSSSYEWLVVTGSDYAMFKGMGTINGALDSNGNPYKFRIWAGDNDPDTFRIKIWQEVGVVENVIYDNGGDQAIAGGSIVIHTKK
jgi:hypothetical protein